MSGSIYSTGFDTHSHLASGMVEGYEGSVRQARPLEMMPQAIDGPRGRYPLAQSGRPENAGVGHKGNSRVDAEQGQARRTEEVLSNLSAFSLY